jgi:hypothetical protein
MTRRLLRSLVATCGLALLLATPAFSQENWTLLDVSHAGSLTTGAFTVAPEWAIWYTYDCTRSKGGAGFVVTVQGGRFEEPIVAHDLQGSSTSYYHDAGTYFLEINSRCRWRVKVSNQIEVDVL